jgi:large subunit ribosomal protein L1
MHKTSKRIKIARGMDELKNTYPLNEALELLIKMPAAKFDETVELSVHLGVDPRQSNQMVRGTVNLPHGSGRKNSILVFTENPEVAIENGADYAGFEDMIKKVQDGWLDFDIAVATPAAMKQVRTIARVLGPRGLMPNPKSGTVSDDIVSTIREIKEGGRIEFKMDKTANLSIVVGKRSFGVEKLLQNIKSAIESLIQVRPAEFKEKYIKNMTISSTMSPGITLQEEIYSNL